MFKKILLILILMLTGCNTVSKKEIINEEKIKRIPPAQAMQQCQKLTVLEGDSFGDVVKKLAEVSEMYKQCELKRKELQDFINNEK